MNSIPLISNVPGVNFSMNRGNTSPEVQMRQEINTSLVALKKEAGTLEGLISEALQILDEVNNRIATLENDTVKKNDVVNVVQSGNMNPVTSNAVATSNAMPVNTVTSGNMHSVTSNAVAISLKEKLNKEYWTLFSDWAPTSEQVMNTYNNRKFSDYSILIFVIGSNNVNTRNTVVLPREVFEDINGSIYIFAHGSNQIVEVDIKYNNDTSIKIQQDVASGNPFTPYIRIYGI